MTKKITYRRLPRLLLCLLLMLALTASLLPATAHAATLLNQIKARPTDGLLKASTETNTYVNYVGTNLTITGPAGQSGLIVPENSTVYLFILPATTLIVNGGSGSGVTGGGAGIEVPASSKLVLMGSGTLIARGGSSGRATDGSVGGAGALTYVPTNCTWGRFIGGYGGSGGGGAGAGIGGKGGTGGARTGMATAGVSGTFVYTETYTSPGGLSGFGADGNAGTNGGAMGTLEVLGEVKVQAVGGYVDPTRGAGAGGGAGGQAASIGGGGAGGGGTFSRTSTKGNTNPYRAVVLHPGEGAGGASAIGYGGYAGSYSSVVTSVGPSSVTAFNATKTHATNGGFTPGVGGNLITWNSSWAGSGGNGGVTGLSGAAGTVKKTAAASISGRSADETITTTDGAGMSISLSFQSAPTFENVPAEVQNAASAPPAPLTLNFGDPLPLTVPVPTLTGYKFLGYFWSTQAANNGTQVYDHRGLRKYALNLQSSNRTIYAWWSLSQFKVTFNVQGGEGASFSAGDNGEFSITDNGTPYVITQEAEGENDYCLLPTNAITVPRRAHYVFGGYFSEAAGQGTQYYNADGTPVMTAQVGANTTVFANWTQTERPAAVELNGGSGGFRVWVGTNGIPVGSLTDTELPTRTGYSFNGYWTQADGGTQIYTAAGAPTGSALTLDGSAVPTLYAQWTPKSYEISYQLGENAVIAQQPAKHVYNSALSIPDPTLEGKVFAGWQINGGSSRLFNLTIPADDPAWAQNIILTATWTDQAATSVIVSEAIVVGNVINPNDVKEDLKAAFDNLVTDNTKGITVADMTGEDHTVTLTLSVAPYTKPAADPDSANVTDDQLIDGTAQGTPLQYYDLTVTKTVTTVSTGKVSTTNLTELPVPIRVQIDLSGKLANQPSYSVYRVHKDGDASVAAAERLPLGSGQSGGEYYDVSGNTLTVSTRKFSTYAVAATKKSLSTIDENGELVSSDITGSSQGVDVQGRVRISKAGKVYKIDLGWGAMRFVYSTTVEWDHEKHMYSEGGFNGWVTDSFDGANNRLTVLNHSNGQVRVNFSVASELPGVDMKLHLANEDGAAEVPYLYLDAAWEGATDAELIPGIAYLRLVGTPTEAWLKNEANATFAKAGVITATVVATGD